eukprot:Lithocolla_globosa_v1_NODE_10187_length_626_cov_4.770578.p3 type:complete len:105 gc:universal NODE_10187_length_626_cov_4.770578:101-415(+)
MLSLCTLQNLQLLFSTPTKIVSLLDIMWVEKRAGLIFVVLCWVVPLRTWILHRIGPDVIWELGDKPTVFLSMTRKVVFLASLTHGKDLFNMTTAFFQIIPKPLT